MNLLAADPIFDPAVFGVAGGTILILLYILRILWADNREIRHEKDEIQGRSLEQITAVATTAANQLAESAKAMEAATIMMHQLAGRQLSAEQFYELIRILRDLKERPS